MAYSRRLFFFDKINARDGQQKDLFAGFSDVQPTCTSSGRGFLWIGDASGFIYRLDRGQQLNPFKAFTQAVRHVYQLKQQDLLLTIGVDEFNEERMKIWNTAKWANKPTPYCSRSTTTAVPGQTESPVSCLCVDETLQLIVFGHTNGHLQLLRGDITRDRHCKRHLLHTFACAVTGLGIHLFCSNPPGVQQAIQSESNARHGDPQGPVIFVTTDQCIMSFILNKRDEVLCKTVLDRFGASANCSSMFPVASDVAQFAVACRDAVYFYNWDGRGPCLATDGNKLALSVFKQYLVILKGDPGLFLSTVGNMPRSHSATNVPTHTTRPTNPTTVVIHDQQNKFITGEFTVYGVRSMFTEWDGIYLLCLDTSSEGPVKYTLTCLNEKSTQAKLDMLFEKKNFQLAIDIAKSHNLGQEEVARIFWRYADHLYKQKEYDTAIQQYVKTIGILEASFVIQRFLEGGHIVQLAYYLEALDSAGLASSDHLVLLLNCYARLQDKERIAQFVQGPVRPQLNVSTAIQVLRQASYPQAALKLAEACNRFVDQVGILIEDMDDCAGALASIGRFPFDEALKAVCAHGHWLMDRLPTETVQLLDQLCSRPGTSEINVHHFLKIFINNRDGLMQFLERYVKTAGKSIKVAGVVDALLELVLYEASRLENDSDATAKLTVCSSSREHLLKLALSLLRDDQLLYDSKKALLICHQRGFFDGCVYLWEKERLYDQLLKHYMNLDDTTNVLLTCTRFGAEMPDLWLLALRYFASKPDCADALHQVVSEVDQRNLISPMAVLQILSDTDAEHSCQLGTVRDYLLRHLEAGTTQIAAMHHQVQQLRDETMHNREVVRALTSQIKIFQQQKCALCHQSLEPPSVHFLCDHSYHKLCFENYAYADQQCPECAPRNKKLLADTTIDTSCSSSIHVADQLRVALHTDHPSCENSTSDMGWNGSSASTSSTPQLPKILASRMAQGSFGPSVGQPRPQSPLTLSTNAIQMSVLQPSRKTDPIKTQEPSILQRPVPISNVTEACAPVRQTSSNLPASSFEPIKSTSSGYYSVETAELQSVAESTVKPGANPFGDSDTENDIGTEIGSTTDHPGNLRPPTDADLGQSRVSLNPFDV